MAIVLPGVWWVRTGNKSSLLGDKLQPLHEPLTNIYVRGDDPFGDWLVVATETAVLLIGTEGRIKRFPATQPSIEKRDGYLWITEQLSSRKSKREPDFEEKHLTQIISLEGEALLDDVTSKQLRQYSVYPIYRDRERAEELRLRELPRAELEREILKKPSL